MDAVTPTRPIPLGRTVSEWDALTIAELIVMFKLFDMINPDNWNVLANPPDTKKKCKGKETAGVIVDLENEARLLRKALLNQRSRVVRVHSYLAGFFSSTDRDFMKAPQPDVASTNRGTWNQRLQMISKEVQQRVKEALYPPAPADVPGGVKKRKVPEPTMSVSTIDSKRPKAS